MGAAQILKSLLDVVPGEIMAKTRLNLQILRRLVSRNDVDFLPGEAAVLRLDAVTGSTREVVSVGKPWLLVGGDGSNLVFRTITPDGRLKVALFTPPDD